MDGSKGAVKVYYARGVEGLPSPLVTLRASRAQSRLKLLGIEVVDPVAHGRAAKLVRAFDIVESDLHFLKQCDAVLMDMSIRDRNYVGCCCELVYAFMWGIPTIVYVGRSGNERRKWLIYHASTICKSFRDAINAVIITVQTKEG
jgi:nucleoside 2-deoxyribosyltransferase